NQNYLGFAAPTMVFCYIPRELGEWTILDLGFLLGHLAIVAESLGLATCFQATLGGYPDVVAPYTKINGNEYKLVVGFSIGYADKQAKINQFKTTRAPLDECFTMIE